MWPQYDENLNDNNFLGAIQKNHSDIIRKASDENWIVCVPRSGVFESEVSIDVILDHVLVHGQEDNYYTLNKKPIIIKNKHICTDVVYQQIGIEILFEEIFYINKTSKYTVWCIDQPLFIKYKYCDSHKCKNLMDLSDCVDFLWSESLGHGLLNDIKCLVEKFTQNHEELASESLQTVKESVGKLYSQCLQLGLKRDIVKEKSRNSKVFLDNFKLSVETYMQHCLGRNLIFAVNTSCYGADAFLNKLIRNSADFELDDLGISHQFLDALNITKRELGKINSYDTILDKINCMKNTFNIIYKNSEQLKLQITSDNILEILVYLITKLKINNWISNIIFMKEFRLSLMDNTDQCSFFITNLEAAIEFIKSNHFLSIQLCKNKDDPNYLTLEMLSQKLSSGGVEMDTNLSVSTSNNSESSLCHPLCSCEKCQESLDKEPDTQSNCKEDESLLIAASKLGFCDVVEYLLKTRLFNVNARDCCHKTCLHYAAAKGHQDILLLSIICNADVNAVDNDKNSPLHLACMNGHENCVKALIYATPEVELNLGNNFGETPLHLATRWGFLEIIKILVDNGASMIIENNQKQTVACMASNYFVLRLFQHFSSLHISKSHKEIRNNHTPFTQEKNIHSGHCKEHGVRPRDVEQYKKIDLLLKAIEHNDIPLAYFYLGFTSNSSNSVGSKICHPLCRCEKCNSEQDSEDEIKHNNYNNNSFNINMCNVNGYTPLHIASKYGRKDLLRMLLDSGALPNVKTYKTFYTPLHLACINNRIQIVRELLNCGSCTIDENDFEGNSPLFHAVANNDVKIVEILVSNGADCTRKNYADRSPLQESKDKMYYRVFKILKNNSKNVLEKNSNYSNVDEFF